MNATLPRLHSDPRSPAMASPLPDLPVVRCAAHSPHTSPSATPIRGGGQVSQGAGRLDGHGPQRNGVAKAGQDANTAAAGRWSLAHGLRDPEPGETGLSAEEIRFAATLPRLSPAEHLRLIHSRCIEEGSCWLWQGALDGHGRPQKRHEGRTVYVRRLVRELFDGAAVPANRVAANACGRALCVSPACSVVATNKERARMAADRGAYTSIARTVKVMLTKRAASWISDELVQQIRVAPAPASRIAKETGVSLSHVKAIRRGAARRDISSPFAGLMA